MGVSTHGSWYKGKDAVILASKYKGQNSVLSAWFSFASYYSYITFGDVLLLPTSCNFLTIVQFHDYLDLLFSLNFLASYLNLKYCMINQVKSPSIPQLPKQKELFSSLRPYHAKLVGESYLGRKRPVYECTDVQVCPSALPFCPHCSFLYNLHPPH